MNELFDWILGHPIVAIGLLYLVFRAIFGKSSTEQTKPGQDRKNVTRADKERLQRERAEALKVARAGRAALGGAAERSEVLHTARASESLQERIIRVMSELERKTDPTVAQFEQGARTPAATPSARPVQVHGPSEPETVPNDAAGISAAGSYTAQSAISPASSLPTRSDDPYAFRSAGERRVERKDYDLEPASFSYKPAVAEPAEQAFHLKGFSGFHVAHGMSASERRRTAGEDVYDRSEELESIQSTLDDVESVRRAIIMSEILGKPRSLRRFGN